MPKQLTRQRTRQFGALLFLAAVVCSSRPARATAPLSSPIRLTPLQSMAAQRGGEALYLAEKTAKFFWPTLRTEDLALMIVEPGQWAVLLNHPAPPSAFAPAEPVARYRSKDDLETGDLDPNLPAWSVHVATGDVETVPESGTALVAGVSAGVVAFQDVGFPIPQSGGLPPSEATICRMLGRLYLAHLDRLEGPPRINVPTWNYRDTPEDLALVVVEQGLLSRAQRLVVNEKTMERYRKLLSMWVATRRARAAGNPVGVAMAEAIERREGLALFTETLPFRFLDHGAEARPALEGVDPLFHRYAGGILLRLNHVNYPLGWYPMDGVEALSQAGFMGAAIAYTVTLVAPRWYLDFLSGGAGQTRTLRAVVSSAVEFDPNGEAALLEEAKALEGFDGLVSTIREMAKSRQAAAASRESAAPRGKGLLLALELEGQRIELLQAPLRRQDWLGPGRLEVRGPFRMTFAGGELALENESAVIETSPGAAQPDAGPARLLALLPEAWSTTVAGKPIHPVRHGRPPRRSEGGVRLEAGGLRLRIDRATVEIRSDRLVVTPITPGAPVPPAAS